MAGTKRRTPTDRQLQQWQVDIDENGYKKVSARALLKSFGFERRGKVAVEQAQKWLAGCDPPIFTHGLETRFGHSLDDSVTLAHKAMLQIGKPFAQEQELVRFFESKMMRKLKLTDAVPQYAPKHTRDRFDFLCHDGDGCAVVVELKRYDGEKRGVEQVLRYIGQLREEAAEKGHKSPRGILITNYADPATRYALIGQDKDRHVSWWVYGVQEDESIALREVEVPRRA